MSKTAIPSSSFAKVRLYLHRTSIIDWGSVDPWSALMVGIASIFSLLILAPLLVIFWLSFFEGSLLDPVAGYSLKNYTAVFADSFTYRILWNTAEFSLISLAVAFLFGLPTAWLVERTDFPGKTILLTFMTIGLLIPGFAVAMGWLFLLHPRIGLVNQFLQDALALQDAPLSITTVTGMGWVQGLNLTPVAFIMTASAFRAMDPKLEEAAETSGASTARMLFTVTIPLIWPGVLAAGIYIFTVGLSAFDVPAIIGWSNRIFTFSTYMYLLVSPQEGLPRYGAGATFSIVGIILAAALAWWYARVQKRSHQYEVITGKAYQPKTVKLGRRAIIAWLFVGAYLVLSKLIPLAMLIWASLLKYFEMPSLEAFGRASLQNYSSLPWELILQGRDQYIDPDAAHSDPHDSRQSGVRLGGAAFEDPLQISLRLLRFLAPRRAQYGLRHRRGVAGVVRTARIHSALRHALLAALAIHRRASELWNAHDEQLPDSDSS